MRNNHTIIMNMECKCPFDACGKTFYKRITVNYMTNQRGDVIDERVR